MKKIENLIKEAIEYKKMLCFSYDGYLRHVEPHHYGLLNHCKQLHGYQVSNGSRSGKVPQWKNFRLDRIRNLSIEPETSFIQRKDHNPSNSHYSRIIKSVEAN